MASPFQTFSFANQLNWTKCGHGIFRPTSCEAVMSSGPEWGAAGLFKPACLCSQPVFEPGPAQAGTVVFKGG
ncbi:MAG: hypothetical protein ACQEQ5_12790, partial [Thermodesulfobacteriota bacterium]